MREKDWMHITPGAEEQLNRLGIDTVESALRCRDGRYTAMSPSSDTMEVLPPMADQKAGSVFLKRYRYSRRSQRIKTVFRGSLFGRSRARFEYHRLMTLRANRVPAIKPLAIGERRVGPLLKASLLITQAVPGQSLLSFAQSNPHLAQTDRRDMIETQARQVRQMHDSGVVHGSLCWRDILVTKTEEGGFGFVFIDPGYVGRFNWPGCRRLGFMRDLAEIAATAMILCSRTDRMRFAKTYLGRKKLTRKDRRWLRSVIRRAERLVPIERHRMEVNQLFIPPP
ncbi:MAG: lipopolysaccharide kinase InaA family protein [Planctomycetota bacterium]